MPDDSALYRAIDPAMSWSMTDYLLARLDYDVRLVEWRLVGLASGRRTKQPKPMRTPIDDRPKARARKATRAEMDYIANRLNIPDDRR